MQKKKYIIQDSPFIVPTTNGRIIKEHFVNISQEGPNISMLHLTAPAGWSEPFQTSNSNEYTYIISSKKQFIIDGEEIIIEVGQSIKIEKSTRAQYSNPYLEPCEYITICIPAFTIDLANRENG